MAPRFSDGGFKMSQYMPLIFQKFFRKAEIPVVAFRAKCKIFSRHLQKPILKTEKGRFKGL